MLMQISCEACLHLFLPNFEASSGYAQVVSEPNLPPYDENGNPYWLLENTNFTAPLSILNYDGSNNALSLSTSFNISFWVQHIKVRILMCCIFMDSIYITQSLISILE